MIRLLEYTAATGDSPFANWREKLDPVTRARITVAVLRMEAGNFSAARSVGAGVSELRLDFGPGYRVYFGREGDAIVILLGGGTKRRQQADIQAAQRCWQAYKKSRA